MVSTQHKPRVKARKNKYPDEGSESVEIEHSKKKRNTYLPHPLKSDRRGVYLMPNYSCLIPKSWGHISESSVEPLALHPSLLLGVAVESPFPSSCLSDIFVFKF